MRRSTQAWFFSKISTSRPCEAHSEIEVIIYAKVRSSSESAEITPAWNHAEMSHSGDWPLRHFNFLNVIYYFHFSTDTGPKKSSPQACWSLSGTLLKIILKFLLGEPYESFQLFLIIFSYFDLK